MDLILLGTERRVPRRPVDLGGTQRILSVAGDAAMEIARRLRVDPMTRPLR